MIKAIGLKNIKNKIYTIRGNSQVMLDRDLAVFYDVETRTLNQASKKKYPKILLRILFPVNKRRVP